MGPSVSRPQPGRQLACYTDGQLRRAMDGRALSRGFTFDSSAVDSRAMLGRTCPRYMSILRRQPLGDSLASTPGLSRESGRAPHNTADQAHGAPVKPPGSELGLCEQEQEEPVRVASPE